MDKYRFVIDTPFPSKTIISYGLMVYAKNTQKWAIIQRKNSIEFLLIVRGFYRLTYLPSFISKIVPEEGRLLYEILLTSNNDSFINLFINILQLPSDELDYALLRINQSKEFILKTLNKLDLSKNKLLWTWPKGRLQISPLRESPLECAKRESIEELEIDLPDPIYISDTYITEIVSTITGKNIESRYWIYVIPYEIPISQPFSHLEVSNRIWTDIKTCESLFDNNTLLSKINHTINTFL